MEKEVTVAVMYEPMSKDSVTILSKEKEDRQRIHVNRRERSSWRKKREREERQ